MLHFIVTALGMSSLLITTPQILCSQREAIYLRPTSEVVAQTDSVFLLADVNRRNEYVWEYITYLSKTLHWRLIALYI
jgi:hypothetical protein